MSYQVKKLPGVPVILTTLFEDYEPLTEMPNSMRDTLAILDSATAPLTIVLELNARLNMEQIIYSANMAARSDRSTWTHPNTHQVIMVTDDPIAPAFLEGMRSGAFAVNFSLCHTVEAALEQVREQC